MVFMIDQKGRLLADNQSNQGSYRSHKIQSYYSIYNCLFYEHLTRLTRKPTMWFPNRSDINEMTYNHRWLESGNFRLRKRRNCTIRVAKTKVQ